MELKSSVVLWAPGKLLAQWEAAGTRGSLPGVTWFLNGTLKCKIRGWPSPNHHFRGAWSLSVPENWNHLDTHWTQVSYLWSQPGVFFSLKHLFWNFYSAAESFSQTKSWQNWRCTANQSGKGNALVGVRVGRPRASPAGPIFPHGTQKPLQGLMGLLRTVFGLLVHAKLLHTLSHTSTTPHRCVQRTHRHAQNDTAENVGTRVTSHSHSTSKLTLLDILIFSPFFFLPSVFV